MKYQKLISKKKLIGTLAIVMLTILIGTLSPVYASSQFVGTVSRPIAVVFSHKDNSGVLHLAGVQVMFPDNTTIDLTHAGKQFALYQYWKSTDKYTWRQLNGTSNEVITQPSQMNLRIMFRAEYSDGNFTSWVPANTIYVGYYQDSFSYFIFGVFI